MYSLYYPDKFAGFCECLRSTPVVLVASHAVTNHIHLNFISIDSFSFSVFSHNIQDAYHSWYKATSLWLDS